MINRELREASAYIIGALGFFHELLLAHAERPFLLTASLALMGFPLVFRSEQKLLKAAKNKEMEENGE